MLNSSILKQDTGYRNNNLFEGSQLDWTIAQMANSSVYEMTESEAIIESVFNAANNNQTLNEALSEIFNENIEAEQVYGVWLTDTLDAAKTLYDLKDAEFVKYELPDDAVIIEQYEAGYLVISLTPKSEWVAEVQLADTTDDDHSITIPSQIDIKDTIQFINRELHSHLSDSDMIAFALAELKLVTKGMGFNSSERNEFIANADDLIAAKGL